MFRNCFADFYLRLKRYRAGSTSARDFNEGQRFGFGHGSRQTGKVIKNLTQDDFVLLEEGVSQKIDYFSEEANLPPDRWTSGRHKPEPKRSVGPGTQSELHVSRSKFYASEQIARLWFSSTLVGRRWMLSTRLNEPLVPGKKRSRKSRLGTKLPRLIGYYVNRAQTIILKCD